MSAQSWKNHERRTARLLGGQRLGATGKSNPDVETPTLSVECKSRRVLPAWISLTKVCAHAKRQGKTGIVVLHETGRHDSVVLVRLSDFNKLTGQNVDLREQERETELVREMT